VLVVTSKIVFCPAIAVKPSRLRSTTFPHIVENDTGVTVVPERANRQTPKCQRETQTAGPTVAVRGPEKGVERLGKNKVPVT
jgi:hypothetical protein